MTIIPLQFSITRNVNTNKKLYKTLHTNKVIDKPMLPKDWQTTKDFDDITTKHTHSFAIRCDNDLVVIDCDTLETTELISDILYTENNVDVEPYVVISDKGMKHFYFSPTDYYRKSAIYKTSRVAVGKIDVLHGRSLVYAVCQHNETKRVFSGNLSNLTPIPDVVVDALLENFKKTIKAATEDYKPVTNYLAPIIEQSITLYTHHTKGGNYIDMQNLMHLITPYQYRKELAPDLNPKRLENGRMTYLHAISFKISNDPSISFSLHCELISLISTMLERPMDPKRLKAEIFDYVRKECNGTRWQYKEGVTNKPLVSINGQEYCPIYRTLEDEYILSKPTGNIELVKSTQKFKLVMSSKNYSLLVGGNKINLETNIAMKKLQEAMETLTLVNIPYHKTGVFSDNGSLYYNSYIPTKYLGIIRGEYKTDLEYQGPQTHEFITKLIKNVMTDNDPIMYDRFIQFLAHKLKTLEYSPIVFQLMGNRGTGKSKLMSVFQELTGLVGSVSFNIKTEFNGELADKIFLNEDEGLVTQHLINTAKTLSGSNVITVRKLYQEKQQYRNIATYMFTTNKTVPMAETIDDRRFVTLSSFKAEKLIAKDMDLQIALELEAFALMLRETKLSNPKLYYNAVEWHDHVHYDNFNERQQTTQHIPSKVANIIYSINNVTGVELYNTLVDCFGQDFHYSALNSGNISIPLARVPKLVRLADSRVLTHEITREELKAVELDVYIKRDTNKSNPYGQTYYKLVLPTSPSQMEEFENAYNSIEILESDGSTDI